MRMYVALPINVSKCFDKMRSIVLPNLRTTQIKARGEFDMIEYLSTRLDIIVNGLSPGNHYLNQFLNIVNWTLGNKLKCSIVRSISLQEHSFENAWKLATILSPPQCISADIRSQLLEGNTIIQTPVMQHLWIISTVSVEFVWIMHA